MEGFQMRRKWQSRLRELTTHRNNVAAFKLGIEKLMLKPELLHSSTYQKILDDNRKTTIDLLYSIGKQLDKSQQQHLATETLAIAQDFDDLACKEKIRAFRQRQPKA
jgi:hemoglobin-like flavoprotein